MNRQQSPNYSGQLIATGRFFLKKKVVLYVLPILFIIFLLPMCGMMNDPTMPPYSSKQINIFMEVSSETNVPLVDLMVYHFVNQQGEVSKSNILAIAKKFKYQNSYEEEYQECRKDNQGKEICEKKTRTITYEGIYSLAERLRLDGKDEDTIRKALELQQIWSMRLGGGTNVGLLPGMCVGDVSPNGKAKVNSLVQSYDSIIRKYAREFGVEPYVEVMKAIMMAESGGKGSDPFQSSESGYNKKYPRVPGGIKDPEYSIYVGVLTFREALQRANYDILTAIQTYNFGPYFADWIKQHGGKYTLELAKQYSREVLSKYGMTGTPDHALKVISYYEDAGCQTASGSVSPSVIGANGWVWPTKSTRITSYFGPRKAPCSGCSTYHPAVDIGATNPGVPGDPVWAMADGVVTYSGLITNGGNAVFIDHGNGVVSRYIHLEERLVKNGQVVKKGQIIGKMGGTGGTRTKLVRNAYPVHLDFQIKINGNPVDPLTYFPNVR